VKPDPPGTERRLFWLCAVRFLMTLVFMTYAASLPVLRSAWGMSAAAAGSVSTGFQIGYGVSLFGFSWLADRVGAQRIFLVSATASAAAAVTFALLARSYLSGLLLYTLVALSQGGTYSTAIMLISDQYDPERRGGAVGWLIASSSLSYAVSLLITGFILPRAGYPMAFVATALGPVLGVGVAWFALRSVPNVVHPRPRDIHVRSEVLRNPQAVRLTLGYTAHTWELLGMWAWTPAFLAASFAASGSLVPRAVQLGAYLSASFHLMGLLASTTMGRLSDLLGRRRVLLALAATSTACAFIIGWLIASPVPVVVSVGAIFGFTALGDSPVLSVALTEAVRPAYLGTALAIRSLLGFGAGAVAPLVFGAILDATNPAGGAPTTWGWAYAVLGAGGLIAVACAHGLRTVPRSSATITPDVTSQWRQT
jgi:MFS family permease